jgi:predicted nuclease with TOPRIM domain
LEADLQRKMNKLDEVFERNKKLEEANLRLREKMALMELEMRESLERRAERIFGGVGAAPTFIDLTLESDSDYEE